MLAVVYLLVLQWVKNKKNNFTAIVETRRKIMTGCHSEECDKSPHETSIFSLQEKRIDSQKEGHTGERHCFARQQDILF